ncbi:hypothetical protein V7S43_012930 [Phytophthora oleae]|uniref:Calponin-homology (CH) domain-containing protein n=1 Tax=Phytophthora oleae TaxID=2107226 RepID=A0ABD3F765_9STRA
MWNVFALIRLRCRIPDTASFVLTSQLVLRRFVDLKHTAGYCKVKPSHLQSARARGCRIYQGSVNTFPVGEAALYRHTEEDSFVNFWKTLAQELQAADKAATPVLVPFQPKSDRAPAVTASANDSTKPAELQPAQQGRASSSPPDDGMTIRRSCTQTKRDPVQGSTANTGSGPSISVALAKETGLSAAKGKDKARGGAPKRNSKGKTTSGNPSLAFKQFQRVCEYGRFEALMQDDSDSEIGDQEENEQEAKEDSAHEEAAYAYPDSATPPHEPADEEMKEGDNWEDLMPQSVSSQDAQDTESQRRLMRAARRTDDEDEERIYTAVAPPAAEAGLVDVDMGPAAEPSSLSRYVGSSAPTSTQPSALTPGSEFPYSIASSDIPSDELAQQYVSQPASTPEDPPSTPVVPPSQASSSSPVYAGTLGPRANPVQARQWLSWFEGSEGRVPGTGQCAILALYATVSNCAQPVLKLTRDVVKDANNHKRAIYALMIENLQTDCELGLLDPIAGLTKLHPGSFPPESTQAVIAILCKSYMHERHRSVAV